MEKQDIVKEYLSRFPDAKTSVLAHKIMNEVPALFPTFDAARSSIRILRGSAGTRKSKDETFRKEKEADSAPFPKLPKPLTSLRDDWSLVKIVGDEVIAVLGDIHIPYYDKPALETAIEYIKKRNPTIIFLNGDIFDFFKISFWQKDPRARLFKDEINDCKQFLKWLRATFPDARIIFKEGNHELRYTNFMITKAPELLDINSFDITNVLELANYGVEYVADMRPVKFNELVCIHGHEYRFAISNPVNPARGLYLKAKVNALTNHFHQSSSHSEKDIEDKVTSCWSVGCLADLHPDFMPLNKHNHGFAIVETSGRKNFSVSNHQIIDRIVH